MRLKACIGEEEGEKIYKKALETDGIQDKVKFRLAAQVEALKQGKSNQSSVIGREEKSDECRGKMEKQKVISDQSSVIVRAFFSDY